MPPIVSMPSWTLPDVEGEREGMGQEGGETKVQIEGWTGREEREEQRGE